MLALLPATLLGAIGLAVLGLDFGPMVGGLAWIALVGALLLILGLVFQIIRPRVAYRQNHVLFYLQAGAPIEVPVDVVEAFFLGQGPANLPGNIASSSNAVNLVARLSQQAPEWEQQAIKPALGRWHESYVTIRGTWCEPLDGEVVRRINRRLAEVSKAKQAAVKGTE